MASGGCWASHARVLPWSLEQFPWGAVGGWWARKLSRWGQFARGLVLVQLFWFSTLLSYIFRTHVLCGQLAVSPILDHFDYN